VDALIGLIATEDITAGRYSAFAIGNVAANANYRDKVVNDGGMPALVSLACCGDANAQRQALTAIRGLCITPQYRALAVREGILDPLILMARSDELETLRWVSGTVSTSTWQHSRLTQGHPSSWDWLAERWHRR
jgi:hypothetical protein